jgi:hypothetical protein
LGASRARLPLSHRSGRTPTGNGVIEPERFETETGADLSFRSAPLADQAPATGAYAVAPRIGDALGSAIGMADAASATSPEADAIRIRG